MRELGIAFEERLVPFEPTAVQEAFRAFSPTAKVPCLIDGETRVWDSLAITEYLAERRLDVWPAAPDARAWARCAVAEMHSGFSTIRNTCSMNCGVRVQLHEIPAALAIELGRLEQLWSEGLERFGGPFLAGERFTAVDAFFAPMAFRVQTYSLQLAARSAQYLTGLLALRGMRAWYEAALAETFRDQLHELEIARYGRLTQDLRAVPRATQ